MKKCPGSSNTTETLLACQTEHEGQQQQCLNLGIYFVILLFERGCKKNLALGASGAEMRWWWQYHFCFCRWLWWKVLRKWKGGSRQVSKCYKHAVQLSYQMPHTQAENNVCLCVSVMANCTTYSHLERTLFHSCKENAGRKRWLEQSSLHFRHLPTDRHAECCKNRPDKVGHHRTQSPLPSFPF